MVLIHGPRQCGKTTLARMVGEAAGFAYLSFDDDLQRSAAQTEAIGYVGDLPERVAEELAGRHNITGIRLHDLQILATAEAGGMNASSLSTKRICPAANVSRSSRCRRRCCDHRHSGRRYRLEGQHFILAANLNSCRTPHLRNPSFFARPWRPVIPCGHSDGHLPLPPHPPIHPHSEHFP